MDVRTLLAAHDLSIYAIVLLAALAFLLALWGTPVARSAALRFGIVDAPDGGLKRHREPVPYMGGIAVYLAVLVALLLVFEFDERLLALLLAAALMLLLGFVDDLGALSPRVKFAGQFLAAWVLVKADVATHVASLPGWANTLITVAWLVGIMNAINIIDIMDGLATTVAAVAALTLVLIALLNELPLIAAAAAALFGACLGFLHYNRAPARIYLGDAGSLSIGLLLGGLSLIVRYSGANELAVMNPLLILCVPLFDTTLVALLRMKRGLSPFRGSPDHFALRLRRKGWSVGRVVAAAGAAGVLGGALAIVNMGLAWPESLSLYVVVAALSLGVALSLARVPMSAPPSPNG